MWGWDHQMWEKNKWTIECDKNTITCDVDTPQCEDDTIKCEKKNKGITECDKKYSHMWCWYCAMCGWCH